MTISNSELSKVLDKRHPDYDGKFNEWLFYKATYDGGRAWFEKNIFKYVKEGETEYAERLERAYRFNHTREVVDLVNKYIFKAEIARKDDAPEYIKAFWENATLQKRDIDHFMPILSSLASIYGRVWVVVDSNIPNGIVSKADAKKAKGRCYCYTVSPTDVLDLAFDDDGELLWIKIREAVRDDADPFSYTGNVTEKVRVWTRNEWYLFSTEKTPSNAKYELEDSGEHGLGIVPVTYLDHSETESPFTSTALIAEIAYLDKAVANYLSNLDAIIQDQTFSQLVIPAEAVAFTDDDENNIAAKLLEFGTKRIFLYHSGETNQTPEFIAPDPKQAGVILAMINKIIGEIYHSVGMSGERTKEDNAMGIDNSSGVAKAYDFERMNAMLANKAKSLEFCENRILRLVKAWNGDLNDIDDVEEFVNYSRDFDVRNLSNEFDIANNLAILNAPKSLRQEQMRNLVEKLYPQLSEQIKKTIDNDISKDWVESLKALETAAIKPEATAGSTKTGSQGQNNKPAKKTV
jgi:hypothetical protein